MKKQIGFTLIELLFIVVIVGIVMMLVVRSYEQRGGNIKIDKEALQMKEILQAGNLYFRKYNSWPTRYTCTTPSDFVEYLPVSKGTTIDNDAQWGNCYFYGLNDKNRFAVVDVNVPARFAYRLASQIPNGEVTCPSGTVCIVSTFMGNVEVTPLIVDAYTVMAVDQDGTSLSTKIFSCPTGWTPAASIQINGIRQAGGTYPDQDNDFKNVCIFHPAVLPSAVVGIGSFLMSNVTLAGDRCDTVSPNNYKCYFNITNLAGRSQHDKGDPGCLKRDPPAVKFNSVFGSLDLTHILWCVPPSATGTQ